MKTQTDFWGSKTFKIFYFERAELAESVPLISMYFRKQFWNRLVKWVFHPLLSKTNTSKKPLSILLLPPCPTLTKTRKCCLAFVTLLNHYLSDRCWQSGFFQCSLQVWKCWSLGSTKISVKISSSLKPLINDKQVSIHASYANTAICRVLGNCICLWISTEAWHTHPGKWQKGRPRGDAIHSLPAVVVSTRA